MIQKLGLCVLYGISRSIYFFFFNFTMFEIHHVNRRQKALMSY